MKGLLVIPDMARAILRDADPKTNTRRVIVPQPKQFEGGTSMIHFDGRLWFAESIEGDDQELKCDYVAGERRCLLTTWAVSPAYDYLKPTELRPASWADFWHAGMGTAKPEWAGKSRPGRFLTNTMRYLMPVVEIVSVRAERVQDITTDDILAEGVTYPVEKVSATQAKPLLRISGAFPPGDYLPHLKNGLIDVASFTHENLLRAHWCSLWDSINDERGFGWAVNPWVWVIKFRRVAP